MYMCKPGGYSDGRRSQSIGVACSDQVHSGLSTLTWPYRTTPSPNEIVTKKIYGSRNFGPFSWLYKEEPPFTTQETTCTPHF